MSNQLVVFFVCTFEAISLTFEITLKTIHMSTPFVYKLSG